MTIALQMARMLLLWLMLKGLVCRSRDAGHVCRALLKTCYPKETLTALATGVEVVQAAMLQDACTALRDVLHLGLRVSSILTAKPQTL